MGLSEDRLILISRYMVEAPEPQTRAKRTAEEPMRREALEASGRPAEGVVPQRARASMVEEARRKAADERMRRQVLEEVARRAAAAEAHARREAEKERAQRDALDEAARRRAAESARPEPAEVVVQRAGSEAAPEATAQWAVRLGATAALAVLISLFSWALTGSGGLTSVAVALATIGASWSLVALWHVLANPRARGEEETLRVLSERLVACRLAASEARAAEMKAMAQLEALVDVLERMLAGRTHR